MRKPSDSGQDGAMPPAEIAPVAGDRGRISADLEGTLQATLDAWDDLIGSLGSFDLRDPSRKSGRSAGRILVVLGSWPEGRPLPAIRADALAGITTAEPLRDIEARVIEAHEYDPGIIDALRRAREDIAEWADSADLHTESLLPVGGALGVVPLGTLVAASAYQCAVAGLDLGPCGVQATPTLLDAGLIALIDAVGAVAAQQHAGTPGDPIALAVRTPTITVATCSAGAAWRTEILKDLPVGIPSLTAPTADVLDIASGRASAFSAYADGRIQADDLGGLLRVARMLATAPGLPGTDGLGTALAAYSTSVDAARRAGHVAASAAQGIGRAWKRWRG